jgi:hypothetical protein
LVRAYALSFAAALLVSAFGVSAQASDADFKLVNKTGFPIDEVHVSPHRADHWGGNIIPGQVLHDNETLRVHIPHDVRACHFDIMVRYHDGGHPQWDDVNVCDYKTIVLNYNPERRSTHATYERD